MGGPRAMKTNVLTNQGYCLMGEIYLQSEKTHGFKYKEFFILSTLFCLKRSRYVLFSFSFPEKIDKFTIIHA